MFEFIKLKIENIDRKDLLYWLQVSSAALGAIVSAYNVANIINSNYSQNPAFFRSKRAFQIYVGIFIVIVLLAFVVIKLAGEGKKGEAAAQELESTNI